MTTKNSPRAKEAKASSIESNAKFSRTGGLAISTGRLEEDIWAPLIDGGEGEDIAMGAMIIDSTSGKVYLSAH